MSEDHAAIIAASTRIAEALSDICGGQPTAAVFLAFGTVLGNIEMHTERPNRPEMLRLIGEGMDQFIRANATDAAHRLANAKIEEAASVNVGACNFCPSVHINLFDRDGDCFATASVP